MFDWRCSFVFLFIPLSENTIRGTIPTTLSNLNNLKVLNLATNRFNGTLPKQSLRLRNLEKLFLSGNSFIGVLPNTLLHKLPKLTMLDLSKNKLIGTIPLNYAKEDGRLVYIYLDSNQLSGILPEDASGLKTLQVFDAEQNQISGTIPTSWMSLTKLESFNLGNNLLTGTIPTELLNLSDLSVLVLVSIHCHPFRSSSRLLVVISCLSQSCRYQSENRLRGKLPTGREGTPDTIPGENDEDVPKGTWSHLSKLFVVLLNDNQLSGTLPSEFIEASANHLMK
jgi:Leucine-rich repeat (LRR) protein